MVRRRNQSSQLAINWLVGLFCPLEVNNSMEEVDVLWSTLFLPLNTSFPTHSLSLDDQHSRSAQFYHLNGRQGLQEEICQAVLLKVKVKFATFSFRVNLLGDPMQWTLNPDKRWRKAKHSMADYQNFFPRKLADISRVDTSDCCFKWNGEQLTKQALALFDIQ